MNAPILAVLRSALLFLCLLMLTVSNESLAQRGRVTPIFNSAASPRYTPPRPMMPTQVTPRTPQFNTAARGPTMAPGTTTGVRMARPLPVTIKPNSAVAQVSSYTGRVTVKGAPIVVSRTGKTFSVPQVGVFSTRIITRYQTIKNALIQKFGNRVVVLKQTIIAKLLSTKAITTKIGAKVREGEGKASIQDNNKLANLQINTPYGPAKQSMTPAALELRKKVENGLKLYRIGTTLKNEAAEAQFWATEHPNSPEYIKKYGIPSANVKNPDFIEEATLKPNASFVTREAPGLSKNTGGAIEVVVNPGDVQVQRFTYRAGGVKK